MQPAFGVQPPPIPSARVLLVSCYELGQEPLGLAVPAGVLARAGIPVHILDLAVSPLDADLVAQADLVAISTPMHTALRLGVRVAAIVREANPHTHICFFGLYAELNQSHLVPNLADSCLGAEFEAGLTDLARRVIDARANGVRGRDAVAQRATGDGARSRERAIDLTPLRAGFSHREGYAKLALGGERYQVGYVVTTRGCKHLCRHCPLPPAYAGSFYALPLERVLDDIDALVARGARHLTFADADFLNGPTHALRIAREIARRFPSITFDYTAKIEHLHVHERATDELRELGALFVVSAVESFNDAVLSALAKGHTRAEALAVIRRFAQRGHTLRPTFVPFTPWETRESSAELFQIVEGEGLVEHI
ncbi:MAG TPA: radical SAM protein, partial [Candidatus Krumholzibacteria bacterium]|nr:radical SAM protein [Candidatus Krumholzibacteria bacterium]